MNDSPSLLTDRYQLTMLAAYARTGYANRRAVFELFARRLPPSRRFMVACGIGRAVEALRQVRFSSEQLDYLEADEQLGPAFRDPAVRQLFASFRFRGRVLAIPEGRVCFPYEPLVRVEATLAEAQLIETLLLSIFNHDTRVASKCARIVAAAKGRECFEFGSRRTHERAAVDAARAAFIAGFVATSNEEAAFRYGIPVRGTMAHAFILAHAADAGERGELAAFRDFAATFAGTTTCLVDTFETLRGVDLAIEAVGQGLSGVRLDSGDLLSLSIRAREILDAAGLAKSKIVASNDLDEYQLEELLAGGASIDAFGVGTNAVNPPDHGSLGAVYKLVSLEDREGRMVAVQKRAGGKGSTAAPKQVYRSREAFEHLITIEGEPCEGEPLLTTVFEDGKPVGDLSLGAARKRLLDDLAIAPSSLLSIAPRAETEGFPSRRSERLWALHDRVEREGRVVLDDSVFQAT